MNRFFLHMAIFGGAAAIGIALGSVLNWLFDRAVARWGTP